MVKELSKQLCELCGIKPKYYFYDPMHKEFIEIIHKAYLKLKNEYQTKEVYPDFGKPENFMRLFVLITQIEHMSFETGCFCIPHIPSYRQLSCLLFETNVYRSENPDPVKAFLECLIKHVKEDIDTADYIREAEWVYGIEISFTNKHQRKADR